MDKPLDDAALRVLHQCKYPDLSRDEFRWLVDECAARRLNLYSRHLYTRRQFNALRDNLETMICLTIDGFRAVAADSGQFLGTVGPAFAGPDLQWSDVWVADAPPYAARVGVLRAGFREPSFRAAKWDEFAQFNDAGELLEHWHRMPSHMLGIRAEALALRAAFPECLGGIYTPDELDRPPGRPSQTADGSANARRSRDPAAAATTTDGPCTPMQFELALLDLGYADPGQRRALAERLRARNPFLARANPPAFYAWALRELVPAHASVGAAAGGGSA